MRCIGIYLKRRYRKGLNERRTISNEKKNQKNVKVARGRFNDYYCPTDVS